MAESSTPVRQLQHHLRESGLLMAAGQFDAAAGHLDAALAIDPQSLAALALREKLTVLRASHGRTTEETSLRANAPAPASVEASVPAAPAGRFVPHGVDAASWTDFEQRVQQRRFRALIESGERALAARDFTAARAALEEARELQPESLEVSRLSIRLAATPLTGDSGKREGLFHSRTVRAASLLLLGVSLLMGLDWVRSDQSAPQAANPASIGTGGDDTTASSEAASVYEADALLSAPAETDVSSVSLPAPDPAQLARRNDEGLVTGDSAPARASVASVTAPAASSNFTPTPAPAPNFTPLRRSSNVETPAPPVATTANNRAASTPVTNAPAVGGEIPDNYVAPRRPSSETRDDAASVAAANRSTPTAIANVVRQPVPFVESLGTAPSVIPSTPVSTPTVASPPVVPGAAARAPAIITTDSEKPRVRSVLDQYARAYGRLDASAVRSVWPTVDEGALAKAFSTLSSQTVSFDNCDIDVEESTSRASALCRGKASYVGKVGSQEPRTESRTVKFELKRDGDAWKIQKAQTGR